MASLNGSMKFLPIVAPLVINFTHSRLNVFVLNFDDFTKNSFSMSSPYLRFKQSVTLS